MLVFTIPYKTHKEWNDLTMPHFQSYHGCSLDSNKEHPFTKPSLPLQMEFVDEY